MLLLSAMGALANAKAQAQEQELDGVEGGGFGDRVQGFVWEVKRAQRTAGSSISVNEYQFTA